MLQMMTDDDFEFFVECIKHEDPQERVYALKRRRDVPSGDPRVLEHLEAALEDKTVCMLGLPPTFGEMRYLAAQALAAERSAQEIDEAVVLEDLPEPLNVTRLELLCQENELDTNSAPEERYRALLARAKIPRHRFAPLK